MSKVWLENMLEGVLCFLKALGDKCLRRSIAIRAHVARQVLPHEVQRGVRDLEGKPRAAVKRPFEELLDDIGLDRLFGRASLWEGDR